FTEVIARLDPDDLYFVAETQEHLRLLDSMGGVSKLQLRGDFSEDELRTSRSLAQVTHLRLDRNGALTDLSTLSHLSGLRTLVLTRCSKAQNLTPLSALSLQSLDVARSPAKGGPLLTGLDTLTTLKHLKIDITASDIPPSFFPHQITWLDLHVFAPFLDAAWIAEAFPELRQLGITFRHSGPRRARLDLTPLATLPTLEAVTVARAEITGTEWLTDVTVTALDTVPLSTGLPADPRGRLETPRFSD
ncbi:ATP-binding protein, partial [Streptomyces sp. 2MCAF27]